MEYLPNGYTMELPRGSFPLSTDSMVLGYFARLPKNAGVLDLGSGCGTLGLLLCAKDPNCHVTGFELTTAAHDAALENIRRNHLSDRMESICADLRQIPAMVAPGSFDVCVSNPPYFSGGPASRENTAARREDTCTLSDLMRSARWALKFGGDFFLVHKPERLAEIITAGGAVGLEAKRLCLLRHKADAPVNLVLVQLRKGGKPGLRWEELCLQGPGVFFRQGFVHIGQNFILAFQIRHKGEEGVLLLVRGAAAAGGKLCLALLAAAHLGQSAGEELVNGLQMLHFGLAQLGEQVLQLAVTGLGGGTAVLFNAQLLLAAQILQQGSFLGRKRH